MRGLYYLGLAYVSLSAAAAMIGRSSTNSVHHPKVVAMPEVAVNAGSANGWFQAIRPYCNPVEVETRHQWMPAPATDLGIGYSAACYALAGKIDRAREIINKLPAAERWKGAGIVFNVAHPVADAGDDLSAGPIMELVVEYWPNHYMALYHAGISTYSLGQPGKASGYLTDFLEVYEFDDGWRRNASDVLSRIEE